MVILDVFKKNISITYKTTLISKAAFVTFVFGILSIVLPFIFAYKSKGFWVKREVFYEQPDVKFKGEYIFVATTDNISNPVIICSVLQHYKEHLQSFDTCAMVKVRETDKNYDGKVDEFYFNLQVNLPSETQITSLCIIVPLDYKLLVCPLYMQTAIIFQNFLPVSISNYMVVSDVKISQSTPLKCHSKQIDSSYNYSIINEDSDTSDYEIGSIIKGYSQRNVSTTLKNIYTSFIPGKTRNFIFDMNIRYPEDTIYYKPGFWQIMKQAWIQYITIYLIISWLVHKIQSYIFNRRLVLFYEDNPFKKKQ